MTIGAFSQNVDKLFPELKLVIDNLSLNSFKISSVSRPNQFFDCLLEVGYETR